VSLKNKCIVLGVTGSIAAYKAAEIVSLLVKRGADVHVVMTQSAKEFITPMTLRTLSRNPVASDMWDEVTEFKCGHIDLADRADLLLVAPVTAHTLACFANGLAPDLLTSIYLATEAPVMLAPAMNCKMYQHVATQANLAILRSRQRHSIIEPASGVLACGYEGIGKLAPVDVIEKAVVDFFQS